MTDPMVTEILQKPADTAVVTPVVKPTIATDGVSAAHVAVVVTSREVPSEYVPVAFSCVSDPAVATIADANGTGFGVIAMDCNFGGVTLSVALPDTEPDVAVITVVPIATALASPEVESTVPTDGLADDQLTLLVKLAVVSSEYVPVASNCWVNPADTLGVLGVIAMDCSVTGGEAGVDEPPPPPQAVSTETKTASNAALICAGR